MKFFSRILMVVALAGLAACDPVAAQTFKQGSAVGDANPYPVKTLAPAIDASFTVGKVTAVTANTSTIVCAANANAIRQEIQVFGTGGVLLGLDGQTLTAVTPAAGTGTYAFVATQYTIYVPVVGRTNAITAYTGTAQTVVCNTITR